METVVMLLVLVLIVIVVIPIVCLVKILQMSKRLEWMERTLYEVRSLCAKPKSAEELIVVSEDKPVEVEEPEIAEEPEVVEEPEVAEEPAIAEEPEVVEEPVITEQPAYAAIEQPVAEEEKQVLSTPAVAEPVVEDAPPTRIIEKPANRKPFSSFSFENLLSKIGIVTLVLGVGFFVKYAIDKDWINEIGRVAIGILTGGVLVGIAHKLRKKYDVFSAIMVGGGIAVFYITITLAFREYELFSQPVAFILLILITVFSVLLSLLYNRKELALFSLLGGYASPLLISTGAGNYIVLFTYLLILNSGMLIISMRKKWRVIGIVSFVGSLFFYWTWLVFQFEAEYAGAFVFAALFFVQFYLLALTDHFLSDHKISPYQVWVILLNNLSAFAASIYIANQLDVKIAGLLTIIMAVVNAAVMWGMFGMRKVDKRLIFLIIAVVLSFVSLAIPIQLDGHVITMFWAAEFVILLWMWMKTDIKVFYQGFVLVGLLTIGSYLMDMWQLYDMARLSVIFNSAFITGAVVIAALCISRWLLQRTPDARVDISTVRIARKALVAVIIGMVYVVPVAEIYYQFNEAVDMVAQFGTLMLATYTTVYLAVLTFIYRKAMTVITQISWFLFLPIVLYLIIMLPEMISVRNALFSEEGHKTLFLLHYLPLPAIAYIFYAAATHMKLLTKNEYPVFGWLLVICAVVILSVELESTAVQLWGNSQNYYSVIHHMQTTGYPILWGVLATILMVWGLKRKEVLLRKISLGFFGFIIVKFYLIDIWKMSQTGRILSFVALGIILLFVSFLIQKIKVLIKKDEDEDIYE